ncbi:hypothetical protein Hamer_G022852 [Homarus americanus]|uniref:Uncharacterized protein n=1 Tax=Homarus americanus TaxID=6706 RepID=A0A8J5MRN2_HOMAM|nr:hypothetical protein Hamer_G022852 [Homarus americanus]
MTLGVKWNPQDDATYKGELQLSSPLPERSRPQSLPDKPRPHITHSGQAMPTSFTSDKPRPHYPLLTSHAQIPPLPEKPRPQPMVDKPRPHITHHPCRRNLAHTQPLPVNPGPYNTPAIQATPAHHPCHNH